MSAAYNTYPVSPSVSSVLIATPNVALRKQLGGKLATMTRVAEAGSGAEALSVLEAHGARIVVLDRKLPDLNCEDLIHAVEEQYPGTDVVLLDGQSGAVELPGELRASSIYQLFKPLTDDVSERELAREQPRENSAQGFMPLPGMIGESDVMRRLAALVRVVARHSASVLLTGETGVGKEIAAQAIHALSPRADKPFVTINCAAIPDALVESELFGHTRGAFTGAAQARLGRIHSAHGGTIFFDEIGELPLSSQSKLLRFLETGEVQRLGTSDVFRLDVRVVAATNVNIEQRVAQGLFREDLFYRLSVFPIELSPLRERLGDVPDLVHHFLRRFGAGESTPTLNSEAVSKLMQHGWPGNVRELRNVMERAFILADGARVITTDHIVLRRPPIGGIRSENS